MADPDLRAVGVGIKSKYAQQSASILALSQLLDPRVLMDMSTPGKGRFAIEQIVKNRQPDGSGEYEGIPVGPQLMWKIMAALNRTAKSAYEQVQKKQAQKKQA